jgi:broad specificity phosphatase PhoE
VIAFVRHGQTALNRDGRLQGRIDAPLSEVGLEQAAALGRAFAHAEVAGVVASPLQRASATAAAIAALHHLDVDIDDRLIELDYGEWDGIAFGEVPAAQWAAWREDPAFAPPGGERLVDVTKRIASFLDDTNTDDLTIAVTHVSPIKAAICLALGVDERASWRMHLDIAAISRVGRRPDGGHYLASFNEPA